MEAAVLYSACATTPVNTIPEQPIILERGRFAVGGTVMAVLYRFDAICRRPAGQTQHGDHAYKICRVPANEREPLLIPRRVIGQSSRTLEIKPDGREGYQNCLLRRGFSVNLIDRLRRGLAGRSTPSAAILPAPEEYDRFGTVCRGIRPDFVAAAESQAPKMLP